MSKRIRHRGPDWSGIYSGRTAILAHERLSIVDPASGGQPLVSPDGAQVLCVNGEIYNHRKIREELAGEYEFQTGSDCEVILALDRKKGINFLEDLSGIFAFALYDQEKDEYLIARDQIGVIPLYIGRDDQGHVMVSSELKGLEGFATSYEPFLPGHYYHSREGVMKKWYSRDWENYDNVKDNPADAAELRKALEKAVQKQLMSDVPYGVLLSGGLDSSIISAIAKKYSAKRIETDGQADAWWPQLHSFAVGLKGAPDLAAAEKSGRQYRYCTSRDKLHGTGRIGCHTRCYLLHRNLRCHHRACIYPYVPSGTRYKKHGYKDGAIWRRGRRSIRRIPVFPQSPRCQSVPRGNVAQDKQTVLVRLP